MTLIMVTHDVYLKNFASKVITLRDGKISKEEIIPKESRTAAIDDLLMKLEDPKHNSIGEKETFYKLLPGKLKTEERLPTDYPTYSKNIAEMLNQARERKGSIKVGILK